MFTADYEYELFRLIPELEEILRNSKELYNIIEICPDCSHLFLEEASKALKKYRGSVLNSFTIIPRLDNNGKYYKSRLANNSIKSLNRIPKDIKRNCRGFRNFKSSEKQNILCNTKKHTYNCSSKTT